MKPVFREIDPASSREAAEALRLREEVLRKPLGLRLSVRDLAADVGCFQIGGFVKDQLVAVLLLKPEDDRTMRMRQVAVAPLSQRTGLGSGLVQFAEKFARQKGLGWMTAHAREDALPFYLGNGYEVEGARFVEIGIPHCLVSKTLGC